jgi:predicted cupin superfamily sugar epimerase
MLLLFPDGSSEKITLGQDLLGGQKVQFMAPRGVWQGSRLIKGGVFALIGTTMAPGFDYSDLVLGNREALIKSYPERGDLIRALSR